MRSFGCSLAVLTTVPFHSPARSRCSLPPLALLRQSLRAFVQILGLDWSIEDIEAFLKEKDRGHIAFINTLAVKIRLGNEPGNRTMRVRNWWPGRWYIVREYENGEEQLFLFLENPEVEGGWQEVGKARGSGSGGSATFLTAKPRVARPLPRPLDTTTTPPSPTPSTQ